MADKSNAWDASGMLSVTVTEAEGATPVPGAVVTVYRTVGENREKLNASTTDASGRIAAIKVPAPLIGEDQSFQNPPPYAVYYVEIDKQGYYTMRHCDVQVFDGQETILNVQMLPLPAQPPTDITKVYITPPHSMTTGSGGEES